MSGQQTGNTRKFPLALAAIKSGKYRIECINTTSARGAHQLTVVYRGRLVVHDTSTPGQALRWIQEREAAIAAGKR